MQLEPISLAALVDSFDRLASQLLALEDTSLSADLDQSLSPRSLTEAMHKVFELLALLQEQPPSHQAKSDTQHDEAEQDIQQLGDSGLNLLADLASIAGRSGQPQLSHELEALSLPFAIWIIRHGGELRTLESTVNAIANLANALREPSELARLYALTGEIQLATSPQLQKDLDKTNPGRPWRILLLNRAIIATRTHRPELIKPAYDNLVVHLPEEAPQFFRQGMQQMVALDYPQPVKNLVENYYNLWSAERTLH